MICLPKKLPASPEGENCFMVKRPAKDIGRIKKTSSQSILLRAFSAIT
jgi:hypothetical protein